MHVPSSSARATSIAGTAEPRPAEAVGAADPRVLSHIGRRDVALAIWQRRFPTAFAAWLDDLAPETLPRGRWRAEPGETWDALMAMFDTCNTPDAPGRTRLALDIVDLVTRFATIAKTPQVDIRLEALSHDACWKFHRDRVPFRLLATYRGPGTEWVNAAAAAQALAAQRRYTGPLARVPRFAAAMFKGLLSGESGVVHRSPPIAESGVTRLLLCLDVPADTDRD